MIVIPMVGKSSRFFNAGYTLPKYQLLIGEETVFSRAVGSFERYFDTDEFCFLVREDHEARMFIDSELAKLGVKKYRCVFFTEDTRGQAETVYLGLRDVAASEPLFIFNIDTFRPGFVKAAFADDCDGYLEVFKGEGDHWSFAEGGIGNTVLRTTEKERISDLCSDGLYYFRSKASFDHAFEAARDSSDTTKGEFYIAPLYNRLIASGMDVRYQLIAPSEVVFCGTPAEYRLLL